MGTFWVNGFYGSLVIIGIVGICGMIQAMCQFCIYIYPKIKSICKCLKDILITICKYIKNRFVKIHDYINSSCNNKIINKNIFFKNPVIPFNPPV
jgi:hypothetical protein